MTTTEQLPGDARVWIYQAEREFSQHEIVELEKEVTAFIDSWTSHSKSVKAGFEIRYNRFLILMLDENHVSAGGCSIDSSVHFIKSMESRFQNVLTDRMKFAFKTGSEVEVVSKNEFEKLLADGTITTDTSVFNNLITTKRQLDTDWEVPVKQSWHRQFFGVTSEKSN
jgi:hypothetical protein